MSPIPARSRSLRAHILLIAVVAIWGSTFVVVKSALADVSPLLFNLIRMTLAFLCLAFFYRGHFGRMNRRSLLAGAIVGLCLAMGYQFQTAGLRLTTPSKSAFITGMVVVLVPCSPPSPPSAPAAPVPSLERLARRPRRLHRHRSPHHPRRIPLRFPIHRPRRPPHLWLRPRILPPRPRSRPPLPARSL